jgi:Asp-tRNA(Asn)/Glu-tRNA(Gln) amidotransferase A subunit family amidase
MALPWTHARVPAVSVPAGTLSDLPIGLQLAGRAGEDEALLSVAHWVEIALATA